MNKRFKRDAALVLALLVAAVAAYLLINTKNAPGTEFEITVSGETFGVYPLSVDAVINVKDLCTVTVSGGKVAITQSTCRGGDCVRRGWISLGGETAICLPNTVTVRVLGGEHDFVI